MSSGGIRGISYQDTMNLMRGRTPEYATTPAITYARCYRLVFIVLCHFSINLLLLFCLPCVGTDTLFDKLGLKRWNKRLGNVCDCEALASNYYLMFLFANFSSKTELGWSDNETSLFTRAIGKSELSYISLFNISIYFIIVSRFLKSDF